MSVDAHRHSLKPQPRSLKQGTSAIGSEIFSSFERDIEDAIFETIKVVQNIDSLDSHDHSKMFFKEIRYLTKLQPHNPYIIRVYNFEFDRKSETGKIVMETGHDFRFLLPLHVSPNKKKLSIAQAKFYWHQMVEAIALLHRHGIVHSGKVH